MFKNLPIIETSRLILRPMATYDAHDLYVLQTPDNIFSYVYELDGKYLAWQSFAELQDVMIKLMQRYEQNQPSPWVIVLKETNTVIGLVGFCALHVQHFHAELGYALGSSYQRNGYMIEALKAIIDFAFLQTDLHRIYATCLSSNMRSACVLKNIGMQYEGSLRDHIYKKDIYYDLQYWAILKCEWPLAQPK